MKQSIIVLILCGVLLAGCDLRSEAGYWFPADYRGKKIFCRQAPNASIELMYQCIDVETRGLLPDPVIK